MAEREEMIPVARPLMGEPEAAAARRAILSGWVTQGPEVAALEREFAEYVGAAHACAVSNCTTALHLALLAAGVQRGDDVITVSHSFIATANSIRYCGARPVFVDIEPDTFNMNPRLLDAALTPRTRAILCVHQMGMPCDLRAILEFAARHKLKVVEDAACAIGSEVRANGQWERVGRPHGDIACFSFHPRKLLTTGDGGMLTTRDAEIDRQFRLLRQHGMSISDTARHASAQVVFESYPVLGYNYRLTDIQAAVGREQLKRLPGAVARRREMAHHYAEMLGGIPGVAAPHEPEWARSNFQSYCVRLSDEIDQCAVMQVMLDRKVSTRRGVMCAHREQSLPEDAWACGPEEIAAGTARERLIESERAQDHCILLPLYDGLTNEQQVRVINTLREAIEQCGRKR